jgi:N6-adenosine-specific RNA methylase IME4
MLLSNKNRRYGVIYADPPWYFKNFSARGEGRNAVAHYDCLTIDEIAALPVSQLAADDCVLFLWVTDPMLDKAFSVIEAWGFQFKTVGFYWVKTNKSADMQNLSEQDFFCGLGYWTRANVEQCLLATRGAPPRLARDVRRLIIDKRREHSRKPDEVLRRIERLARGPYLELFGRETRPNWETWGIEAGLFDSGTVETRRTPSRLTTQPRLPLDDRHQEPTDSGR